MYTELKSHIDKALEQYSAGDFYEELKNAKSEYFDQTGQVNEEDDDYESRMNAFNYWYLFQRLPEGREVSLVQQYIKEINAEEGLANTLANVNHSLFEYRGTNLRKKHVLKDILHDKKILLDKDYVMPSIVKNDLFIGRTMDYDSKSFLLDGINIIPSEVRSLLVKESKKVRKLNNLNRDLQFLMQIEAFKTKWRRYGHIDARKIFQFKF